MTIQAKRIVENKWQSLKCTLVFRDRLKRSEGMLEIRWKLVYSKDMKNFES